MPSKARKNAPTPPMHPDQRPDELTASQVGKLVGVQRQTVLRHHLAHPQDFPGRLLPKVEGVSSAARGLWAFKRSDVDRWMAARAAAKARARKIHRLRVTTGLYVNGRKATPNK